MTSSTSGSVGWTIGQAVPEGWSLDPSGTSIYKGSGDTYVSISGSPSTTSPIAIGSTTPLVSRSSFNEGPSILPVSSLGDSVVQPTVVVSSGETGPRTWEAPHNTYTNGDVVDPSIDRYGFFGVGDNSILYNEDGSYNSKAIDDGVKAYLATNGNPQAMEKYLYENLGYSYEEAAALANNSSLMVGTAYNPDNTVKGTYLVTPSESLNSNQVYNPVWLTKGGKPVATSPETWDQSQAPPYGYKVINGELVAITPENYEWGIMGVRESDDWPLGYYPDATGSGFHKATPEELARLSYPTDTYYQKTTGKRLPSPTDVLYSSSLNTTKKVSSGFLSPKYLGASSTKFPSNTNSKSGVGIKNKDLFLVKGIRY